ncbi:MAG: hypothetical protein AAF311_12800 [Pseudomonadota bacterium]
MSDGPMSDTPKRRETDQADHIHPAARPFLFLGEARVKRNFIWLPLAGLIIASILGVFHPAKHPAPFEMIGDTPIPGSWAIFGFLAYSLIVFAANPLFRLLGRREDFYGEGGLPDPDYSTDPMLVPPGGDKPVGKNADDFPPQPLSGKAHSVDDLPQDQGRDAS